VRVKPWELLGRAPIPGGTAVMELHRRDTEHALRVGHRELMNSRQHGSEDALAELSADVVGGRPRSRVLIGGLGMGFTLAAALRRFGPDAALVVAELVPEVVVWNQTFLADLAGRPLDDARVRVVVDDVGVVLRDGPWDAVLLDVDNGPDGFTRAANAGLYGPAGLAAARAALAPGGVLAVWSAVPDAGFARQLGRAGLEVTEHVVRARGNKGARHTIWLARRPGGPPRPAAAVTPPGRPRGGGPPR
jgi:spermidine synthase